MPGNRRYFSSHTTLMRDVLTAAVVTAGVVGAVADEGGGPSGGKLADVPGGHIEFLGGAADSLMMFNVTNTRGRIVALDGAVASVLLKSRNRAEEIQLVVIEPGWLEGEPSSPPTPGSSVTVTIDWPDGRRMRSSFRVK